MKGNIEVDLRNEDEWEEFMQMLNVKTTARVVVKHIEAMKNTAESSAIVAVLLEDFLDDIYDNQIPGIL